MAAALLRNPFIQPLDLNGSPSVGAKLYPYLAGTTTPTVVFLDENLTTKAAFPVEANDAGQFPPLYIDSSTAYKFVLEYADDTPDRTIPHYASGSGASSGVPIRASSAPTITADLAGPQGHIMFLPNTDLTGDNPVCHVREYPNQGANLFSLTVGTVTVEDTTWANLISRFDNFSLLNLPSGVDSTDAVKLSRVPLTWTAAQARSLVPSGETTARAAFSLYRNSTDTDPVRIGFFNVKGA